MATQIVNRSCAKVRSPHRDCCTDECPSGARNNYFLGKRLTPSGYQAEQRYSIERRRLINRAVHGWGVVYGYPLAARHDDRSLAPGDLKIGEGLAFDALGRELIQACDSILSLDNLVILDKHGKAISSEGSLDDRFHGRSCGDEDCWLLAVHYAEKTIGQVTISDPCRCDRDEWDQTCETVIYTLQEIPCSDCCAPYRCELHCCCPEKGCCAERQLKREELARGREELKREFAEVTAEFEDGDEPGFAKLQIEFEPRFASMAREEHAILEEMHQRGGCSCLCEHLTHLKPGADCVRMNDVGDCTRADLTNGVPLACIRLGRDECGCIAIASIIDACGPRRLVKRNDLLFDLINGCDATRIIEVGWGKWHRRVQPVPFEDFVAALGGDGDTDGEDVDTVDFWVRFSRPVREDTLTRDIFAMVVMSDQTEGCWRDYYRVPILSVRATGHEPGDPEGHARCALMVVSGAWLSDGVLGRGSVFRAGETHVEIEVRGDLIEDCLGQTVDANARGRSPFPTGSDGPGDTYISAFTVARRAREAEPEPRQGSRSRQRTTAA